MNITTLFLSRHQQALKRFYASNDGEYYLQHRRRLLDFPMFSSLSQTQSLFGMLKAIIILRGLQQKDQVDDYLKTQGALSIKTHGRIKHHLIRERFLEDIRFTYGWQDANQRIVLPFFNRAMNVIYTQEPDKLFDYPYSRLEHDFSTSIIDAFEHYHYALFGANFTHLVALHVGDRSSQAFYHPDAHMVFIINQQGRLDGSILLFDRGIKKPNLEQIEARLQQALPAYFACDRTGFIMNLAKHALISEAFASSLLTDQNRPLIRREKE